MADLITFQGEQIRLQVAGNEMIGILIEVGEDILVIFDGEMYIYIPLLHIHQIQLNGDKDEYVEKPSESYKSKEVESLTNQTILKNAKGKFSEIYVSKDMSFPGSISNILDDYIAFYSPIFKTMYIPISHFKFLIPYKPNTTLYSINPKNLTTSKSPQHLKVNPSNIPLLPTFEDQLIKEEGKLVIFDGGTDPMKVGLLKKVENNFAELVLASGESVCWKLSHIKYVYMP